jgi:cation-transporting P-type ATPase I
MVFGRFVESARRFTNPSGPGRDVASLAWRTAEWTAGRTGATVKQLPGAVADAASAAVPAVMRIPPRRVLGEAAAMGRVLFDLHPRRTQRRMWAGHGHAHIEVRGLSGSGPRHRRIATNVQRALSGLSGVRWTGINAVTGHVVVAFDEQKLDAGQLLEAVRRVEEAEGTDWEDFSWGRPVHPSDATPLAAATVELAVDCLAVTTAVIGRASRLPRLPRGPRVGLVLADLQPQFRKELSRLIGPTGTEVVLALSYATLQGLSQRPVGPLIDAVHRAQVLAELLARRAAWERREPELCATPETLPHEAPRLRARPQPLPHGPIEQWVQVVGPAALAGASTMLALTRSPSRAADIVLSAVPRAAWLGREAFASTAGWILSRDGILPLDAEAYRRLDRVTAVVLDASVLRDDNGLPTEEPAHQTSPDDAASPAYRSAPVQDTQPAEPALLARAVIDAACGTGARVLLTTDEGFEGGLATLLPGAVETLPASQSLASHVRRLQGEGHGVLLVSAAADEALATADVGVATMRPGSQVCWSADLLCGTGLSHPWRILLLTGAARPLSRRLVQLSQAGSAVGGFLAVVRPRRGPHSMWAVGPVHAAAIAGVFLGTGVAWRAASRRPPVPEPR